MTVCMHHNRRKPMRLACEATEGSYSFNINTTATQCHHYSSITHVAILTLPSMQSTALLYTHTALFYTHKIYH